jgi:hypothetical protein
VGFLFYRQAGLQAQLGVPISASTKFDPIEHLAHRCSPVFNALKRVASNDAHFYLEGTRHRIVQAKPTLKKKATALLKNAVTKLYL